MQKCTLMSCSVQYNSGAVPYSDLLDRILRSYYLVYFILILMSVAPLSHRQVVPATVVDLCLLPPRRLTVTTIRGYLVPLDKINVLSKFGSFLMASFCWFICLYIVGHYVI